MGIMLLLMSILVFAFGINSIRKPGSGWRSSVGWKVKGESEPSSAYLEAVKFSGWIMLLFGSILFIAGILNCIFFW